MKYRIYIKKNFCKNAELTGNLDGTFSATDFCSYPTTVVVEPG